MTGPDPGIPHVRRFGPGPESSDPVLITAVPRNKGADAAVAAARRVIAALLTAGNNTPAELNAIAYQLDAVGAYLEEHAPTVEDRLIDMWSGEGTPRHDPVAGTENAIAPPLQLFGHPDGSVRGTVTLGIPYQGPPGFVHGGISALLLDHAFGLANHWAGKTGMTASLTMTYHRPTPLFVPLEVEARQVRVDGRKLTVEGGINHDGERCVSASGLFITKYVPVPGRPEGFMPGGRWAEP